MNLKAFMAVGVAVAMIGSAFAQGAGPKGAGQGGKRGPGGPGMRRGGPMGFDGPVLDKLNLTAAQKSQVKSLKEKLAKEMAPLREKNRGNREAMKATAMEFGKKYKAGLDKILTPAQQKQYKPLMKAEMEKRRKEMGNRRPGGPGAGGPPPSN